MEGLIATSKITKPWSLWMTTWEIKNRVSEILDLGHDAEWKRLVMKNSRWENMGTISYQFYDQDSDNSSCKIWYTEWQRRKEVP